MFKLLFAFLFMPSAYALARMPVKVQALQPELTHKEFGPGVFHGKFEELKSYPSTLPERESRENDLLAAGLLDDLQGWDELDRDLLWLKAQRLSIRELETQYPKILSAKLTQLRRSIRP